jgi:hypothetical protein
MIPFPLLVPAFVAERAHQWQSLLARDWSPSWQGQRRRRGTVVATALVIGWGEGLGFYVQSERAFWGMIFWVTLAHVVVTAALSVRGASTLLVRTAPVVAAAAAAAAMLRAGSLDGNRPATWFGWSLLPPLPEPAARALGVGSLALAAFAVAKAGGGSIRRAAFPLCVAASGCACAFVPDPAAGMAAFVIAGHAVPCLVRNASRARQGRRAATVAVAAALAALEWWLVARCVWFPEGALFPDLVDWWDLGRGANFLLHPLWMAPFLAHVLVDAIRFSRPPEPAA